MYLSLLSRKDDWYFEEIIMQVIWKMVNIFLMVDY